MADLRFTKSHEWVKLDDGFVTLGISDYAQSQLGDIVFIELSQLGDNLKQLSQFGTIESTKAASELYAPLSGEVIQVNNGLLDNPQWINESAQDKGWMLKIKADNLEELSNFMNENAYRDFIAEESK